MQHLEVATHVFVDRATVFDFLTDFTAYAQYSEHLEAVAQRGDGGPGTEYDITVGWWRLSHTGTSRVTALDRPTRIDWQLVSELRARGAWVIEDGAAGDVEVPIPDGDPPITCVRFVVDYDPESAEAIGLPALVPTGAIVDRVIPVVRSEATAIVERVVADLEGEPRAVELSISREK
ncbi:SRPBCC family protein [Salinarchaeum chitinilyticum]